MLASTRKAPSRLIPSAHRNKTTTSTDTNRTPIDPLALTRAAPAGQRLLALTLDVLGSVGLAVAFGVGAFGLGWLLVIGAAAATVVNARMLARTGRSLGSLATGTRTVVRASGVSAGR